MDAGTLINKTEVALVVHELGYGALKTIWCSDNIEKIFEISKEDFADGQLKVPNTILHPDDHNIMIDFYTSLVEDGYYQSFQRVKVPNEEKFHWVFVNFRVLERDKNGNIFRIAGSTAKMSDHMVNNPELTRFLEDHRHMSDDGWVSKLSEREVEVTRMLVSGHENGEIAKKLNISVATVKKHKFNILDKLGETNFVVLAKKIATNNW